MSPTVTSLLSEEEKEPAQRPAIHPLPPPTGLGSDGLLICPPEQGMGTEGSWQPERGGSVLDPKPPLSAQQGSVHFLWIEWTTPKGAGVSL